MRKSWSFSFLCVDGFLLRQPHFRCKVICPEANCVERIHYPLYHIRREPSKYKPPHQPSNNDENVNLGRLRPFALPTNSKGVPITFDEYLAPGTTRPIFAGNKDNSRPIGAFFGVKRERQDTDSTGDSSTGIKRSLKRLSSFLRHQRQTDASPASKDNLESMVSEKAFSTGEPADQAPKISLDIDFTGESGLHISSTATFQGPDIEPYLVPIPGSRPASLRSGLELKDVINTKEAIRNIGVPSLLVRDPPAVPTTIPAMGSKDTESISSLLASSSLQTLSEVAAASDGQDAESISIFLEPLPRGDMQASSPEAFDQSTSMSKTKRVVSDPYEADSEASEYSLPDQLDTTPSRLRRINRHSKLNQRPVMSDFTAEGEMFSTRSSQPFRFGSDGASDLPVYKQRSFRRAKKSASSHSHPAPYKVDITGPYKNDHGDASIKSASPDTRPELERSSDACELEASPASRTINQRFASKSRYAVEAIDRQPGPGLEKPPVFSANSTPESVLLGSSATGPRNLAHSRTRYLSGQTLSDQASVKTSNVSVVSARDGSTSLQARLQQTGAVSQDGLIPNIEIKRSSDDFLSMVPDFDEEIAFSDCLSILPRVAPSRRRHLTEHGPALLAACLSHRLHTRFDANAISSPFLPQFLKDNIAELATDALMVDCIYDVDWYCHQCSKYHENLPRGAETVCDNCEHRFCTQCIARPLRNAPCHPLFFISWCDTIKFEASWLTVVIGPKARRASSRDATSMLLGQYNELSNTSGYRRMGLRVHSIGMPDSRQPVGLELNDIRSLQFRNTWPNAATAEVLIEFEDETQQDRSVSIDSTGTVMTTYTGPVPLEVLEASIRDLRSHWLPIFRCHETRARKMGYKNLLKMWALDDDLQVFLSLSENEHVGDD